MSKFFNIIHYCISTILDKGSLAIFSLSVILCHSAYGDPTSSCWICN